ncbi:MAG: methyl-accepting chemotaxis protein [Spirochaetota bacterium]
MDSRSVADIHTRVTRLSGRSEALFLDLVKGFPQLVRELRDDLATAERYLTEMDGHDGVAAGGVGAAWRDAQGLLTKSKSYFGSLSERDTAAFRTLHEGVEMLSELNGRISDLKEDALDLEVLAINATVTARHAGEAGRGFAYIAAELRNLAGTTVTRTDVLTGIGADAVASLKAFQTTVQDVERFQRQFFGEFEQRLESGFRGLADALAQLVGGLGATVEKARGIEEPLRRMMSEIQMQDIIMQSLAHVQLVVENSTDDGVVVSGDGSRESMFQLCATLLEDIRDRLDSALGVFRESLAALGETLHEVQRELPASEHSGAATTEEVARSFDGPLRTLGEIATGINVSIENRNDLRESGEAITVKMTRVLDELQELSVSLEKLYPIQMLSRIQVAKNDVLNSRGHAVEGIQSFVAKVREDLGGSESDLGGGLAQVESVVDEYAHTVSDTVHESEGIATEIRSLSEHLSRTRARIEAKLRDFSVFSGRFLDSVSDAEQSFVELESLKDEIANLIEDLSAEESKSAGLLGHDAGGQSAEEIVESLVSRFTIARHKHTAASMVGKNVDHGDEEGELTLF